MNLKLDQDKCISCGLCVSSCPEVFAWDKNDKAKVILQESDVGIAQTLEEIEDNCPVEAIEIQ